VANETDGDTSESRTETEAGADGDEVETSGESSDDANSTDANVTATLASPPIRAAGTGTADTAKARAGPPLVGADAESRGSEVANA
jgi:hypothetical protein